VKKESAAFVRIQKKYNIKDMWIALEGGLPVAGQAKEGLS